MKIAEIPGSLAIVKLDDRHYQLTDISEPSIGLCLGIFPSDDAARSFAVRIASIRELGATSRSTRPMNRVVDAGGLERVPQALTTESISQNSLAAHPSPSADEHSGATWKSIH
jgi:hypothetical protein